MSKSCFRPYFRRYLVEINYFQPILRIWVEIFDAQFTIGFLCKSHNYRNYEFAHSRIYYFDMFIHFRRLSWCIIKIQGGPFLESHPTRTYCGFEVQILVPGPDSVLLRRVCQQDPVSTQGGMDEKKRSTQIWLLMIHKKQVFKKNRLERSQGVRKYRISTLHEGLRSCPPLDHISDWISPLVAIPRHKLGSGIV